MPKIEMEYSRCNNCGTSALQHVCGTASLSIFDDSDDENPSMLNLAIQALNCPSCNVINLSLYNEDRDTTEIIYPVNKTKTLLGLPPTIEREYKKAQKIRAFDPNAYGVTLGRVLDLVCLDKGVKGKQLFENIKKLETIGEIPPRLKDMAMELKNLRNIGGHADLGELTSQELTLLDNLCEVILEYVYHAPKLIEQAKERVKELKNKI